jgi:CrcB protein
VITGSVDPRLKNHSAAVALHYMHYNFVRIHRSLRVTPAMQAGLTDRVYRRHHRPVGEGREGVCRMMTWLAIAIGGAIGSVARHGVNHVAHSYALSTRFPFGTVAVNLVGCFMIGLLSGLIASGRIALPSHWREFVFVGLLGGFTTFSTFGLETFVLARTPSLGYAVINVAVQVVGGLFAVWLGYRLGAYA